MSPVSIPRSHEPADAVKPFTPYRSTPFNKVPRMRMNISWRWSVAVAFGIGVMGAPALAAEDGADRPRLRVADDGTLIHHGERRFVYGTFRDPSDDWRRFEGLVEGRFNLTHSYDFERALGEGEGGPSNAEQWITEAREYLRRAEAHGVGVFLGLPRDLVAEPDLETIQRIVHALKDEPALWFWYLKDEPSHGDRSEAGVKPLQRVYEKLKELDPDRPVVVVDNQYFHTYPYATMSDMVWADRYPAPWGIEPVKEVLDEANTHLPELPRAWSVPIAGSPLVYQAAKQGRTDFVRLTDRTYRPNPKELRAQVHAALAGGARGIIWYWFPERWHRLRQDTPKVWEAICDIGDGLAMLEPALVNGEPASGVTVRAEPTSRMKRLDAAYYDSERTTAGPDIPEGYDYRLESEVLHWTREHEDDLYVGLVNAGYQTQVEVTLELPGAFERAIQYPQGFTVMRMGEDGPTLQARHIPVTIKKIADDGRKITLMMNELDAVAWRFESANGQSASH